MDDVLSSLTLSQRQAVQHVDGPLLILAGPGSGKTRVVIHRVAYLLQQGIPDHQIVALTFTNKAAEEMGSRLRQLAPEHRVRMGTFHRFCAGLLRQYAALVGLRENFSIYDVEDSRKLLREAIDDADVELIHENPARVAAAISWVKNDLILPEQYHARSGDPIGAIVERVYPHYQKRLLAANAVDFDDLLMWVALLMRGNADLRATLDQRFRYILVDEYQDTNLAQYAIVRALSIDHPNLAATGDPDQSIYGWRGATLRNILDFEHDFPRVHVVKLEENFRSTKQILRAADQLIANNVFRKEKTLYTHNSEGAPIGMILCRTGREEADVIAARIANDVARGRRRPRDFAVFYRTNALSRTLERAMKSVGIPYQIVRGVEFYQRKEIKDVLAYLQLINNPANDVAFLRIVNTPPRGIGKKTVNALVKHGRKNRTSLLDAARDCSQVPSLAKRSATAVARFVLDFDRLCGVEHESVESIIQTVLMQTGYQEWLELGPTEEEQQRADNIDELVTDAREFDESHVDEGGLEAFLEQTSLVADTDGWESETDRVAMMTLHAAKGLEFPVVFIVALETGMLPHERSLENAADVEEERRLLFVGMTRAEEELYLSAAESRTIRGSTRCAAPSPFLMELPHEAMQNVSAGQHAAPIDFDRDADSDWEDDPPGEEEWYDQDSPHTLGKTQGLPQKKRVKKATKPLIAGTVTAAEMIGRSPAARPVSPNAFHQGMIVNHPEYGLGKITAVGGTGAKRSATVQFVGPAGEKRFRLAFSPLRPAKP